MRYKKSNLAVVVIAIVCIAKVTITRLTGVKCSAVINNQFYFCYFVKKAYHCAEGAVDPPACNAQSDEDSEINCYLEVVHTNTSIKPLSIFFGANYSNLILQ